MAEQTNMIEGNTGLWEVVIGLEVHAQITSKSKVFSAAATDFGAEPNTQVSPVDAGFPGMLPVPNRVCVEQTIRTGLALDAVIHLRSVFDRKNYFYADLPQGYQISQFTDPIVGPGTLHIQTEGGQERAIGIERIHLEQDAGKSMHDQRPESSFIDLNRAGIGLMEIVSMPDLRSAEEAGQYLKKLRTILRYVGSCDGDMEKGSMRCDANISVRRPGEALGIRNEIKNLNSIRNVVAAIEHEARRQIEVVEGGGMIEQATRLFDTGTGETRVMRTKENAHDYRYFPDPDLLPLVIEPALVEQLRAELPELPDAKKARYQEQMGLSAYDAEVLSADKEIAAFFEEVAAGRDAKQAASWISAELFGRLNRMGLDVEQSPVAAKQLGGLLDRIADGTISGKIAKDVLDVMCEEAHQGQSADAIIEAKGWRQVSDASAIEALIAEVLAAHPDKAEEYRAGKEKLFGFFVGQVMKASKGQANPQAVNQALKQALG